MLVITCTIHMTTW